MLRRVVVAYCAFFAIGGWAGIANAAAPAPSPPPFCFVQKSGALPTCEQDGTGSWIAIYPNGQITHEDAGLNSGTSHTKRDVEIAIVVLSILGIGGIAWWQWGPLKGRGLGRT